jgi:hypothetical protein
MADADPSLAFFEQQPEPPVTALVGKLEADHQALGREARALERAGEAPQRDILLAFTGARSGPRFRVDARPFAAGAPADETAR